MDLLIKQRNKIIITYVDTLFTIYLGDGELVIYRLRFVIFSRQENNRERLLPFAAVLLARWYFAGRRRPTFVPKFALNFVQGQLELGRAKVDRTTVLIG